MKQTIPPHLPPHVKEAWDSGRRLEAIQALHSATGMDLAQAKALLERRASKTAATHPAVLMLQALKAAKAAKASKSASTDAQVTFGADGLAPGEVPRGRNRLQLGLLVAALILLIVWWVR